MGARPPKRRQDSSNIGAKAGWYPDSNAEFAQRPVSTADKPYCPVCEAELAETTEYTVAYEGKTHMFCSQECKDDFVKTPDRFLVAGGGIG
ncbi:MAG: YHS domain-containing protein [Alphaproteobacteria bacterium]|nr:YHS domain-containing protein [Alphaproteobacteria bacterium]MBU0863476.1 YHS domain-containing protein [Alphaproteobacteria bacterium]MBU1823362.1 YHS domain-containing protein [Alphaproteobacteria bacterium]